MIFIFYLKKKKALIQNKRIAFQKRFDSFVSEALILYQGIYSISSYHREDKNIEIDSKSDRYFLLIKPYEILFKMCFITRKSDFS